ncbi:hypothetical protein Cma02nite_31350 [Cellulomonas marina]|nr:hypothetical protein Cma02nite_31350 [Cellulomonas marina]
MLDRYRDWQSVAMRMVSNICDSVQAIYETRGQVAGLHVYLDCEVLTPVVSNPQEQAIGMTHRD